MVVLVLQNVSPSVRGELTRWLLEPRAGVFVGQVSATVRDLLWQRACAGIDRAAKRGADAEGGGILIYSSNTEQGFVVLTHGKTSRQIVDYEGLALVRIT